MLLQTLLLGAGVVGGGVYSLPVQESGAVQHPRLFFSARDLPHLRQKRVASPFMNGVLAQYEAALTHHLNYSAGGVMQDVGAGSAKGVADNEGRGTRHQLAASLYVMGYENASAWGQLARELVYKEVTSQFTSIGGNWFAGPQRELEQLVASYDAVHSLFSREEAEDIEHAFAGAAEYLSATKPREEDMASRAMNPAADRLGALGLIALTLPNHANASKWLADAIGEFKWMLANGVMDDGQWHEPSTRYHGRVLAAFIPFAYALREAGIMDAFNEIPELKRFVGYYRLIQTPRDRTMGGCALTPALSDANWETVWEVTLGWAAGAYARTDPSYAAELWSAWELACAPMGLEPSPPNQLASVLWIGCAHADECTGWLTEPYTDAPVPGDVLSATAPKPSARPTAQSSTRGSAMLSGYAVLRNPMLTTDPYLVMSTTTQRQTEGHEHPDRGSISLYHDGIPLVLDPGVGWCGYEWLNYPLEQASAIARGANGTSFDRNLQQGAWYRGSQSHSMVNFAAEGPDILPENATWRPPGGFGHEWGLRGAAWVDSHVLSDQLDFVDLNITRAVQASQASSVRSYHRRLFANWGAVADGSDRSQDNSSPSYLLWDDIDASAAACAQATFNLHVLTQLGWPGTSGCSEVPQASEEAAGSTLVTCRGLEDVALDVSILRPAPAELAAHRLLAIEADPLPVQFTGMSGSALPGTSNRTLGMSAVGGAFGGDWNADGGIPPESAHWSPRTPTWLRLQATAKSGTVFDRGNAKESACTGFLTLLQPRRHNATAAQHITHVEELSAGAVTVTMTNNDSASSAGGLSTVYLLGARTVPEKPVLRGLAAVVNWRRQRLVHATLIRGSELQLGTVRLVASRNISLLVKETATDQYSLIVRDASEPVVIEATLPWRLGPSMKQVNVWRGARVWHVANSSTSSTAGTVAFEALPGEHYMIDRQCVWNETAGYGPTQKSPSPATISGGTRAGGIIGGWLCNTDQYV